MEIANKIITPAIAIASIGYVTDLINPIDALVMSISSVALMIIFIALSQEFIPNIDSMIARNYKFFCTIPMILGILGSGFILGISAYAIATACIVDTFVRLYFFV